MKTANEIIQAGQWAKPSEPLQCGEQKTNQRTDKFMANFVERMTGVYGIKWSKSYASVEAIETWSRGLSSLTNEQVAAGIRGSMERHKDWPPTLPEFLSLCKPEPQKAAHKVFPKALPEPPEWRQTRRQKALSKISDFRKSAGL